MRLTAFGGAVRDTARAYGVWSRMEIGAALTQPGNRLHRHLGNGSRRSSPRRIILFAQTFPPMVTGGTYRPLALARYGTQLGWKISVVGSEPGAVTAAGRYLLAQVPAEVQVVRPFAGQALPYAKGLPRIDGRFAGTLDLYERSRQAFGACGADFVVASGPPFNQFVAALYLARALGSHLVLDYRDEWTQCPFDFVIHGRTDRWWEARCLRAADLVVFTTQSQLERQLDAFPELEPQRCAVIPNGWEPANHGPRPPRGASAQVTIAYVGTFASFTQPGAFLALVETVVRGRPELKDRLRLQFVGRKHPNVLATLQRFAYPKMLECIDEVPMHEATAIMRSASALLIFNPPVLAHSRTGKLYEYLATRRPILVFGDGGEIASLVRQLEGGVILKPDDPAGLGRAIDALANGTLRSPDGATLNAWLAEHTRERMATRFFSLLERLSADRVPIG